MISVLDYLATFLAVLSLLASLAFLSYLVITESRAPRFKESISRGEISSKGDLKSKPSSLVSVLVAARNEEQMISRCLDSLVSQTYPFLEIIVVDDSSTDNTRKIVSEFADKYPQLRLVPAGPKPEGWVGKSWPCWRGYEESKGQFLLFIDADSTFDLKVIELSLDYVIKNSIDMFSLSPKVVMRGIWAKSVLPIISGAINLLYPMQKVNDKKNERAYVFGTFILVRRSVYKSTGGHMTVRNQIVEDAAIAKLVKSSGYNLQIERGPEMLTTEWESNSRAVYHGLERVSSTSIRTYGLVSILNAILLFFVTLYPIIFALLFPLAHQANVVLLVGLVASILNILSFLSLAGFEIKTISGRSSYAPILYPLGASFFISAIITTSLKVSLGKGINWKGQGYKQPAKKGSSVVPITESH